MVTTVTAQEVRAAIARLRDPEIPVVSIVDLGIVERVEVTDDAVEVDLLPTFAGCPALDVIRDDVTRAAREVAPGREVRVRFLLDPPWTTERITDTGRTAMTRLGIAPPGARPVLQVRTRVRCPYCGADATREDSSFGPTPCRAIRYCPSCRNPFEAFKPKA